MCTPVTRQLLPRYSLWQLMTLFTIVCVLLALAGVIGAFAVGLAVGLYFVSLGVSLLRIQNPFVGGILGWLLAWLALPSAGFACFLSTGDVDGYFLLCCLFLYPPLGYFAGYARTIVNQLAEA